MRSSAGPRSDPDSGGGASAGTVNGPGGALPPGAAVFVGIGLLLAGALGVPAAEGLRAPASLHAAAPLTLLCLERANPLIESGWTALRDGTVEEARTRFEEALALCPGHPGAMTGAGYVALRMGADDHARTLLAGALATDTASVDARAGLGILAWRAGELDRVRTLFSEVLERAPDHTEARDYLARLPEPVGVAIEREPLVLPDTVELRARTRGTLLEIPGPDGWEPLYVLGMNLGAALPGRFPGEFPTDGAIYRRWIELMARMGVNTIRVYTVHPPAFYRELEAWNRTNPARPLYLLHGVWAELPPGDDYMDPDWEGTFFEEMRSVVDLLHGRADLEPRPGHASGSYTANLSEWVLGYIIGREWEPHSVEAFNSHHPELTSFEGRYLRMERGTPMDSWLARALEELVAWETEVYRVQRPVAYTTWPTLDPLTHRSEATAEKENAIREALGDPMLVRIQEYDNDGVAVDPSLHRPTTAFGGGIFAAYHAYPYYPDFMILEEGFQEARSSFGPSRYMGYLRDLGAHHDDIPVVIAEYGVPASLGNSHIQPEGLHHGGLSESGQAEGNRRLTLEIAEAGLAGGAIFAWIDEWFKLNWSVLEFEYPLENRPRWLNRMNAEQHYGMIAKEPLAPVEGRSLTARLEGWRSIDPLYDDGSGLTLRGATDEGYLWLLVETGEVRPDELYLGFDLAGPGRGGMRWPGARGPELAAGAEFIVAVEGNEARVLGHPSQVPYRFTEVETERMAVSNPVPLAWEPEPGAAPPGFFHLRGEQHFNLPFASRATDDGRWEPIRMIMNRRRFTRDSLEVLAVGYERGWLPAGNAPDGMWGWEGNALELRVPWNLIHVTDPSTRTILQGEEGDEGFTFRAIEGIGIVLGVHDGEGRWRSLPAVGGEVRQLRWEGWTEPEWRARLRPTWYLLQETFRELEEGGWALRREFESGWSESRGDTLTLRERAERAWIEGGDDDPAELYRRVLEADPDDTVALLRLGLLRAWDDRYREAIALFRRHVALEPANPEGWGALARTLTWADRLAEGEVAWRRALELATDDPELRAGLVQNLRWQGRAAAALEAAALDPRGPPPPSVLEEQLRWVDASLAARVDASVLEERDSDRLRSATFQVGSRYPMRPHLMLHLEGYHRVLRDPIGEARATGALVEIGWEGHAGWRLRGGIGTAEAEAGTGGARPRGRIVLTAPARGGWSATLRAERAPLDVTAPLARLEVDRVETGMDLAWRPHPRWRFSGAGGWARFDGEIRNPRWNAGAAVERRLGRGWSLRLGSRAFGFSKEEAVGYFSPGHFILTELPLRWAHDGDRWGIEAEGAPGTQRIGSDGSFEGVARGRTALSWRLRPGREVGASLTGSSSGLERLGTETEGGYRYGAFLLYGRWIF